MTVIQKLIEYGGYFFFGDFLIAWIFLHFFLWTNLDDLTTYLKDKYPDEWIRCGSLRFLKGSILWKKNSWLGRYFGDLHTIGDTPQFLKNNTERGFPNPETGSLKSFRLLYQFIKRDYAQLNDSQINILVHKIKISFWCFISFIIIALGYITIALLYYIIK